MAHPPAGRRDQRDAAALGGTAGHVSTRFPADLASIPEARRYVESLIEPLGLPDTGADTVVLLVSELVTNAVVHAHTPFTVELACRGPRLHVGIADDSEAAPTLRDVDPSSPGGRGIRLLAELADDWGCDRRPSGKEVWFEIDGADPTGPPAGP
jgi:anti-sigma regulatory factor (Ser/Thr protein kinase)